MSLGVEVNVSVLAGISLIILSFVFFLIIAILTKEWLFILLSLPLTVIGFYFIKQGVHTKKGVT